jgi:hypothetical protein
LRTRANCNAAFFDRRAKPMLQSALKLLRRHWHELGLLPAIVAGAYLMSGWAELVVLQRLLLLNFIVVLLHQLEEYRLPGGFPAVANLVLLQSPTPDRYPVNQNAAMVANLFFAYGFYLLPAVYPDVIWLGLGPVLIGAVVQLVGHAIVINWRLRSFYNPGLVTTILGHVPVGVAYIYHISVNDSATRWDWSLAIAYAVSFMLLNFGVLEIRILGDKNSAYPFDPDEMQRSGIAEKFEAAKNRRT